MEDNENQLFERFERIKLDVDLTINGLESKVAELVSTKKKYDELKTDLKNLKSILENVDKNLTEFKDMLK